MADPVLVLRPEPGASRTAKALREAGFLPILYPLYEIEPVDWTPPDPAGIDAILITSANAVRQAGPGMARFLSKPLFAVGAATAAAARQAGFLSVTVGGGDIPSTVPMVVASGHRRILHLSGTEIREFDPAGLSILRLPVYRAAPYGTAEGLRRIVPRDRGAYAMVHSPRAGVRLSELVEARERQRITIIAISIAASQACGRGWRDRVAVGSPTGEAMVAGLQMLV
ncbi:MAG TPA: uroporphyrinogen-III synthase [Sphingobium sp.]